MQYYNNMPEYRELVNWKGHYFIDFLHDIAIQITPIPIEKLTKVSCYFCCNPLNSILLGYLKLSSQVLVLNILY